MPNELQLGDPAVEFSSLPVSADASPSVGDRIRHAEQEISEARPPLLTLVIPMYREAERIANSLAALAAAGLHDVQLVLVDDGSPDATSLVARSSLLRLGMNGRVIKLETNQGKGAAVRAGVLDATTEYVGFVDADLSLDPIDIRRALDRLVATRGDVIVGERIVHAEVQPRLRRLASLTFRRLAATLAPTSVRDTQCALKLFRSDVAREVFTPLVINGFAFDVEVLMRLRKSGHSIDEMAIRWTHQPGSTVSPLTESVRMLRQVRRIGKLIK